MGTLGKVKTFNSGKSANATVKPYVKERKAQRFKQSLRGTVRLLGRVVKKDKALGRFLLEVEGIGPSTVTAICRRLNVSASVPMGAFRGNQVEVLESTVQNVLKDKGGLYGKYWLKETGRHLRSLADLGLVRGLRLRRGLPARGQRRKTNAKSCRRSAARSRLLSHKGS